MAPQLHLPIIYGVKLCYILNSGLSSVSRSCPEILPRRSSFYNWHWSVPRVILSRWIFPKRSYTPLSRTPVAGRRPAFESQTLLPLFAPILPNSAFTPLTNTPSTISPCSSAVGLHFGSIRHCDETDSSTTSDPTEMYSNLLRQNPDLESLQLWCRVNSSVFSHSTLIHTSICIQSRSHSFPRPYIRVKQILRTTRDEIPQVLPQTRIARVDVRAPNPSRHEHGVDLRDEAQQVRVVVLPSQHRVILLALLIKVRAAADPQALLLAVISQIRPDDDANVVQVVSLHRMDRPHLLERVRRRNPIRCGAVPPQARCLDLNVERGCVPLAIPRPGIAGHHASEARFGVAAEDRSAHGGDVIERAEVVRAKVWSRRGPGARVWVEDPADVRDEVGAGLDAHLGLKLEVAPRGIGLGYKSRQQLRGQIRRAHALCCVQEQYLMAALGADPIELGLAGVVGAKERAGDGGKLSVEHARGLVGALVEPMGLVNHEQIKLSIGFPCLKRCHHHGGMEPRGLSKDLLDRVAQGLLWNDQADAETLEECPTVFGEELGKWRIAIQILERCRGLNVDEQFHHIDGDDRLASARIALDHSGASNTSRDVGHERFENLLHRIRLVFRQGFERRQLEEVAILNLGDTARKDAIASELVPDVAEPLAIYIALVVIRLDNTVIQIEDPVGPVAGQHADEDNANALEVLLCRRVQMLTHAPYSIERFAHVDIDQLVRLTSRVAPVVQ